jgi:hypothetical protein
MRSDALLGRQIGELSARECDLLFHHLPGVVDSQYRLATRYLVDEVDLEVDEGHFCEATWLLNIASIEGEWGVLEPLLDRQLGELRNRRREADQADERAVLASRARA